MFLIHLKQSNWQIILIIISIIQNLTISNLLLWTEISKTFDASLQHKLYWFSILVSEISICHNIYQCTHNIKPVMHYCSHISHTVAVSQCYKTLDKLPYLLMWMQHDDAIKTDTTKMCQTAQLRLTQNVSSSSKFITIHYQTSVQTHERHMPNSECSLSNTASCFSWNGQKYYQYGLRFLGAK